MDPIEQALLTFLMVFSTGLLLIVSLAVAVAVAIVLIGTPITIFWSAFIFLQGRGIKQARAATILPQSMAISQAMIGEIIIINSVTPSERRIMFMTGGRIYVMYYDDLGAPSALLERVHGREKVLALSCFPELWPLFDSLSPENGNLNFL